MNCLRFSKSMVLLLLFVSSSLLLLAQDQTVTGKVIDRETGRGIVGVTVKLKNSNTATQTDADGNFSLRVPSAESIITFSSVGYLDYEVKAGTGPISVSLTEFNSKMDEVVVVGYGTKKRVNVQGAVSSIKPQDIEDLPVANLQSALVNRVPGVNVSFSSGKPGSTTNITIRNPTTFPNGAPQGITSQPLIVIDGIISNPTIWNQSTNADFLENLDASQIEDITFLKDASAAIYGAAGAKGVILITTKKGKAGKPRLSYSGYYGVSGEAVKSESLSAYEHARFLNDGYEMTGAVSTQRFSQADLDYLKTLPNRSWYDDLWKNGKVMRHTMNISGGSDRITFFAGGSYYNEKGNYGDISVDKYSLRTGIDAKIIDGLTANFSFSTDNNEEFRNTLKGANAESDDYTIRALYLTPKWVPMTVQGQPTLWNGPNPPGNWSILGLFNSGNYSRNRSQGMSVNSSLEYRPNFLKGLVGRIQFGKMNRSATGKEYEPSYRVANVVRTGQNGLLYSDSINVNSPTTNVTNGNKLSEGSTVSTSYQLIATLSYAKKIGNHDFDLMVGMDQGESEGRNIFLSKTNQLVAGVDEFWAFSSDLSNYASITDAIRNPQAVDNAKRSYLSRMHYSYLGRYFVEGIARYDASSNFAPENRWGFFPSVGLGWRLSDEPFFKKIDFLDRFVNNLKLRVNYGLVGEDRIAGRLWQSRFTQSIGQLFGNSTTTGLDPNVVPNRDITWEKSRSLNFGVDATVFKNKINLTADFYHRYTYDGFDRLEGTALPPTAGFQTATVNNGRQISWGSEFSVGYRTNFNKNWSFNADVNFGWSNSQLLEAYYNAALLGTYGDDQLSLMIGRDPRVYNGSNFGFISKGILRTQADVDALLAKNPNFLIGGQKPQVGFMDFEDINQDGRIDDNDITLMFDRTTPVFSSGITLGFSYKEFKFQTNMNLAIGGKRIYDSEARKVPTTTQNAPAFWADHWTPENPNGKFPRADAPLAREQSTFWAVNGTQSRINNAVLSYSLPKRLSARYKIPEMKLMISGTNLWNIVNPLDYKDPYTSNYASYPTLRTISLGLNVSL
jgi:TonB-linked SusC/RagA family outer membrane protein